MRYLRLVNHLNALLLESVAKALAEPCQGKTVYDCFSNSPDEWILDLGSFNIKCLFYKGEILFFFNNENPGKSRLFKPQFQEIKNALLTAVVPHPYERSFHFEFDNGFILLFKCHGRKSNIILFENNIAVDHFRKHLENDINYSFSDLARQNGIDYSTGYSEFLDKYKFLPEELRSVPESAYPDSFKTVIESYRSIQGIDFDTSTLDIRTKEKGDLLEDISRFSAVFLRNKSFLEKKEQLLSQCDQSISEKGHFINSSRVALLALKNKRPEGEIGNIILANLHLIKEGQRSAELLDIYHNCPIKVQLDENLSAVENADRYFKKEKAAPHGIRLLEDKITKAETILNDLKLKRSIIENARDFKGLKSFIKSDDLKSKEENLPYRRFVFDNYEILVGKSADSNEKLLNYFSDKNDIWLHARDVAGSHVIVKSKGKTELPHNILETAASLAAYYSKNRNQNLVTVTYTLRKYVRKIKGADKGKVSVSMDKTLLVPPRKSTPLS